MYVAVGVLRCEFKVEYVVIARHKRRSSSLYVIKQAPQDAGCTSRQRVTEDPPRADLVLVPQSKTKLDRAVMETSSILLWFSLHPTS